MDDTPNPPEPGWYWVWREPGAEPEVAEYAGLWPASDDWSITDGEYVVRRVWAWSGPIAPPACPRPTAGPSR